MKKKLITQFNFRLATHRQERRKIMLLLTPLVFIILGAATLAACGSHPPEANPAGDCMVLKENWRIQSSTLIREKGAVISSPGYACETWRSTTLPSTVLAALVKNGDYKDPYFGKSLETIPTQPFHSSWWYRSVFHLTPHGSAPCIQLDLEGINYRANIWLNGRKIAGDDEVFGAFRTFSFDVSRFITPGENVLAIEVFPPQPGDLTIGFVDWNPTPPDRNMGIWREVKLRQSGHVSIESPFIYSKLQSGIANHSHKADLFISLQLENHRAETINGTLEARIESIRILSEFTLNPLEAKTITFSPQTHHQLHLTNPRLWWPNNMGDPHLYTLTLIAQTNGETADQHNIRFGIREITDYVTPAGVRGYKINGREIPIRGAGWVDDMLLGDNNTKTEHQFRYIKHMNLNTIRIEGFWGNNRKFYELADEYGILIMAGWSCQWEWEEYLGKPVDDFGGIKTPDEMELATRSLRDQAVWLRNHPSLFVWVLGSDRLPRPELEKKYRAMLDEMDPSRPILSSCKNLVSEVSGSSGVKMEGPYDYVPPIYWYIDVKRGGAYGFNTETGPGPQPPPLESLKRMMPEKDLWPINDMWDYHCGRNEFNSLKRYVTALENRYGKPTSVEEFARVAQAVNYEAMRAMFEAFSVNLDKATGVIQWMLNSAWPEMYWQLYDYYLMPNGAFYGARTANRPIHVIYNYGDKSICAVNNTLSPTPHLKLETRLLNHRSQLIAQSETDICISPQSVQRLSPPLLAGSPLYFLDLRLKDSAGNEISRNFYWLSNQEDITDDDNATWFYTPQKQYADFSSLKSLPRVHLKNNYQFTPVPGNIGVGTKVTITLENAGETIAFFIELKVIGKKSGRSVLPIFLEDNYISLLPGEQRTISGCFNIDDLAGDSPTVVISGWNLE